LTAVAQLVNTYSSLPNLLNWETAHEPDGNSDPLNAAQQAYDLIYQMDGYHPISIVLNCEDYNFSPYVTGADIVLHVGIQSNLIIRVSNLLSRMLILLVSTPHGPPCGTHHAPQTLVTVAVTTAGWAPWTMSRAVSRPSKTGSTSWALTAPSLYGRRPKPLEVARKSSPSH